MAASDLIVGHTAEHGGIPESIVTGIIMIDPRLMDCAEICLLVPSEQDLPAELRRAIDVGECQENEDGSRIGSVFAENAFEIHRIRVKLFPQIYCLFEKNPWKKGIFVKLLKREWHYGHFGLPDYTFIQLLCTQGTQ